MKLRVSVNPWAALAFAVFFYYSDSGMTVPLLSAILCHEAGHLLALFSFGCRIEEIRLELAGLCMRYGGAPGSMEEACAALAGPTAGLLYALPAVRFGPAGELSAGISILLSVFNLIPALPLDGGRIVEALFGHAAAVRIGWIASVLTCVAGVFSLFRDKGAALAFSGLLLLMNQFRLTSEAP